MERRLRLREEYEVRAVRNRGKAYADGPLVARILANALDPPRNRYTVVAGKKIGNAVARNRVKRLVREGLRHLHPRLRPGYDVVVIVRGSVGDLPNLQTAATVLERIAGRARLLTEASAARRRADPTHPPSTAG